MNDVKIPHKFWWLWLPLLGMAAQAVLELSYDSSVLAVLHSEAGPHETLQVIILLFALVVALRTLVVMDRRAHPWLAGWMGLAALCCFYVGAEEISWGQHILNWSTPEYWQAINDQKETNLHNTSSWLDQKPRLMLELGVVVGGLLIPALRRWRSRVLPARFAAIYPPGYLAPIALVYVFCKVLDYKSEFFGYRLFERVSEVIELYLYYFVLLYLLFMKNKLQRTPA